MSGWYLRHDILDTEAWGASDQFLLATTTSPIWQSEDEYWLPGKGPFCPFFSVWSFWPFSYFLSCLVLLTCHVYSFFFPPHCSAVCQQGFESWVFRAATNNADQSVSQTSHPHSQSMIGHTTALQNSLDDWWLLWLGISMCGPIRIWSRKLHS